MNTMVQKAASLFGGKFSTGSYQKSLVREQFELQSMIIPGIIAIIIFCYIPMWGVLMAFKEYDLFKGFSASPWVGIKQFKMFFADRNLGLIMRNTFSISFLKLVFGFPAPIILALLFNEVRSMKHRKAFQIISYMPHFISWVVISGILFSLLSADNGSINILLNKLGIIDKPINWFSEPKLFWGILVTTNVWKEMGFGAIIYIAAIVGVNPELYEVAVLDGAGRFKRILHITLPCIAPQIIILLILHISYIMNAGFEDILLLTNNGNNTIVRSVSEVIDTYVYRVGIQNQRFSYATAVGLFQSIVNIAMLTSANAISRKVSETSLW